MSKAFNRRDSENIRKAQLPSTSLCSSVTPVLRQQRLGEGCQIGEETEPNAPNINTARGRRCKKSDGTRGPRSGFGVLLPARPRGDAARRGSRFAGQRPGISSTVCLRLRGSQRDVGSSGRSATLAAKLPSQVLRRTRTAAPGEVSDFEEGSSKQELAARLEKKHKTGLC